MLVPLGRSVTDVRDGDDASRIVTTLQSSLQNEVDRLKKTSPITYWSDFAGYLNGTTPLYASRDGSKVGPELIGVGTPNPLWETDGVSGISPDEHMEKFFEITLTRNTALSPSGAANDQSAGFLAFNITLRWPGYVRFSQTEARRVYDHPTMASTKTQQSVLIIPAAVVR